MTIQNEHVHRFMYIFDHHLSYYNRFRRFFKCWCVFQFHRKSIAFVAFFGRKPQYIGMWKKHNFSLFLSIKLSIILILCRAAQQTFFNGSFYIRFDLIEIHRGWRLPDARATHHLCAFQQWLKIILHFKRKQNCVIAQLKCKSNFLFVFLHLFIRSHNSGGIWGGVQKEDYANTSTEIVYTTKWYISVHWHACSVCHLKTKAICSRYSVDSQNFVYNTSSERCDALRTYFYSVYKHEAKTHKQMQSKSQSLAEVRNTTEGKTCTNVKPIKSLLNSSTLFCSLNVQNVYIQSE